MSVPDEDVDAGYRVLPQTPIQVVTQPGCVRLVHRSGRVLHTFSGVSMAADGKALIDELCGVFDNERRLRRETEVKRPWWRFWK